nr:hypothetical protein [Tanacetum cinerariifolium]
MEIWELKVKGTDLASYTQHFQELALLYGRMFPEESDKIDKAYTAGPEKKKPYGGSKLLCSKCIYHHASPCAPLNATSATELAIWPVTVGVLLLLIIKETSLAINVGIKDYKSDCAELKNQNHGNQAGGTEARGMMHALGGGETNQDLNNMEDDINT